MFVAIFIIPLTAVLLWLFSIRPYCRRNGKGYTPGANVGATFWIDWQEAGEISKAKNDKGMIIVCRFVLWLHILGILLIVFSLLFSNPN